MGLVHAEKKLFTNREFLRLAEEGYFGDKRYELIEGEIVYMAPQGDAHGDAIERGNTALVLAFHETHNVRVQLPLTISLLSGPEPDFAVVPRGAVSQAGIRSADLVIEVAASSLAYDRDEKASLYARHGIVEYWILNVEARELEVFRDPVIDPQTAYGFKYASHALHGESATVSPLIRPDILLRVVDLL